MTGARFRILALDGGGIKGAFTAAALAELESTTKVRVVDHFDLVVGTSTGGILAIALGMEVPPQTLLNLYCERGHEIFSGRSTAAHLRASIRHFFRPKHSSKALRTVLESVLGNKRLGESRVRLVIPTFDSLKGTACTFKTAHHPRLSHEYEMKAVDVAVATASAPTYFGGARVAGREGAVYVDGGVWANCPVLVGIVEAVHFLGQDLRNLHVLSIGTTRESVDFVSKQTAGIFGWNVSLVDVMMAGQVTAAESQAKLLIGERLHRINVPAGARTYKLDDGRRETAEELAALGHSICRSAEHIQVVKSSFLDGIPVSPFVPCYQLPSDITER